MFPTSLMVGVYQPSDKFIYKRTSSWWENLNLRLLGCLYVCHLFFSILSVVSIQQGVSLWLITRWNQETGAWARKNQRTDLKSGSGTRSVLKPFWWKKARQYYDYFLACAGADCVSLFSSCWQSIGKPLVLQGGSDVGWTHFVLRTLSQLLGHQLDTALLHNGSLHRSNVAGLY